MYPSYNYRKAETHLYLTESVAETVEIYAGLLLSLIRYQPSWLLSSCSVWTHGNCCTYY